ncbi:MAG: helix-turn-helix domain-containing protein [Patescibacteria group bacterium]|jgi:sugar-specific transcriptional regulator TrmB
MPSIEQTLNACGFTTTDIEIYLLLCQAGKIDVTRLINKSRFSRVTVYEALHALEKQGLVEYKKAGRSVFYQITHPHALMMVAEKKKQEAELIAHDIQKHIEQLTGLYNISIGKPGIQFFEGEAGLKQALYDSLKTHDTIYTYVNEDIIQQYGKQMNQEYVMERLKRRIHKKIIMVDTPAAHTVNTETVNAFTKIKFLPANKYQFDIAMEIYDDTISYLTVHQDHLMAFVISHPGVTRQQKKLFEFVWQHL